MNFEFKNEATRANLQVNKRILKWRPFWNKVYGCHVARRRRRRRAYAPSSNTASHDDHEESDSWVSMSTYCAAVGAAWADGAPLQRDNKGILHVVLKCVKYVRSRYHTA